MTTTLPQSSMSWVKSNYPESKVHFNEITSMYQVLLDGKVIGEATTSTMAFAVAKIYLSNLK